MGSQADTNDGAARAASLLSPLSGVGKRKEREYEVFRRGVRVSLGAELPERLSDERYLVFDASGRPHLIREANRPTEMIQ